jgi:hypothetical protein
MPMLVALVTAYQFYKLNGWSGVVLTVAPLRNAEKADYPYKLIAETLA